MHWSVMETSICVGEAGDIQSGVDVCLLGRTLGVVGAGIDSVEGERVTGQLE